METENVFSLFIPVREALPFDSINSASFTKESESEHVWSNTYNMVFNTSQALIEGPVDCDWIRDSWETWTRKNKWTHHFLKFNSFFKVGVEGFTFAQARLCACALMFSALLCEDLYSQYEPSCIECLYMSVCMCCFVKVWSLNVYTCMSGTHRRAAAASWRCLCDGSAGHRVADWLPGPDWPAAGWGSAGAGPSHTLCCHGYRLHEGASNQRDLQTVTQNILWGFWCLHTLTWSSLTN